MKGFSITSVMDVYMSFRKDGEEVYRTYAGVSDITSEEYDRYDVKLGEGGKSVKAYLNFYKGDEIVKVHYLGFICVECDVYDSFKVHIEKHYGYVSDNDDDEDDNDDEWIDMSYDRWKEDMDNKLQQDNYGYDEVDA